MTDLTFYTNPMSRGRIVRWMLEEVGVPYRTELLDYATSMKAPDYLGVNPMGKVPAIAHDGRIVTECAAICAYLADAFPTAGLAPTDAERADYYRWLFFAAGPLEATVTVRALGIDIPAERKAFVGFGGFDDVLDTLDGLLSSRPYVTGDRFTATDVYVGSQIRWGMRFKTLPERPAFVAYSDRLKERPAKIRVTQIDDTLIPQSSSAG